jgi:hypothetical protein
MPRMGYYAQLYAEQRRRGTHGDGLERGGKGRFQGADR